MVRDDVTVVENVVLVVTSIPANVALAESPVVPVTVAVYVPLAPEATVKDPDTTPPDTEHVELEMSPLGNEDIEQLESPAAKFDPETSTFVPAGPEVGDRTTVGEGERVRNAKRMLYGL